LLVYFSSRVPFTARWVFWVGAALLLLFAMPVFAAGDSLDGDLETLNRLMSDTPPSKALFWLERLKGQGEMPKVVVKDDLLKPPPRVCRGGAAYHLARAAFIWELGRRDETIRALRQVAETRPPADDESIYDVTIRFLSREKSDSLKEVATALVP